MFGVFHDAGYKGLYNGLGNVAIKQRKGLAKTENLLDRMDRPSSPPINSAREKLAREAITNQQQAIATHETVGREVREAIKRIGGTMPEMIPAAEPISVVEKRLKSTPPVLELEEKDAKGLIGADEN